MRTDVVYQQILSFLDDLQLSGRIPEAVLLKKKSLRAIADALNTVDIELVSELGLMKETAVFIPKDTTQVFLRVKKSYGYKNKVELAANPQVKANIQQISYFLNNESWLDVSGIVGSELFLYASYPPRTYAEGEAVEILPFGLHRTLSRFAAAVDTDAGLLVFTRPLADDQFALFTSRIMPAALDLTEDFTEEDFMAYRIRTPDYGKQVLIKRTLGQLFAGYAELHAEIMAGAAHDEVRMHDRRPGSGPTAYTPEGSYTFK